jgi:hypothetical protein
MSDRPLLSTLSSTQLLERARAYGAQALTASTADIRESLERVARRYADLAQQRDDRAEGDD